MKQLTLIMFIALGVMACTKTNITPNNNTTQQTLVMNSVELALVGNWITDSLVVSGTTATKYNNTLQDHLYLYNTILGNPSYLGTWYNSQGDFIAGISNTPIPWKAGHDTLYLGGSTYIILSNTANNLVVSMYTNEKYYLHK